MEQQQAEVRAVRGNRAASAEARQRLAGLKAELRDYRAGLDPQEREAYRDYRAIRLEVKKCIFLFFLQLREFQSHLEYL